MRIGLPSVQARAGATEPTRVAPSRGVHVSPERTPLDMDRVKSSIEKGYEAVVGRPAEPGVVDVLAAQVATETGYGAKMVGYNFGGIKGTSPEGKSAVCTTREVVDGKEIVVKDAFRAYDSAESGAADYVRLLERRFPGALEAAANGDVEGFAHVLKSKGYFTADEGAYARAMRGAMGTNAPVGRSVDGAARTLAAHPATHIDAFAVPGFATSGDLARVVDAIAASALSLAADGSSRDESEEP